MITFSNIGGMGRLGNQLFQLAAAIALATQHQDKYLFPHWEYESKFNLHGCFSNNIKSTAIYQEPFFHYQKIPYQPNLDLKGFFQSYKYFEDCQDIVLGLLTPKQTFPIQWGITSIHCRYGDYVNNSAYAQLDLTYYNEAIKIVNSKKYLVFSDDIERCKSKFVGDKFIFVEEKDPVIALSLMSSCENNIICNSSFSYWGAYLNKFPGKQIIAPKQWFGPSLIKTHNTKDLLLPEWMAI